MSKQPICEQCKEPFDLSGEAGNDDCTLCDACAYKLLLAEINEHRVAGFVEELG